MTIKRTKQLTALQLRSKLPFGMYKGMTLAAVIDFDPQYVMYARKRGWIRITTSATTILMWKVTGKIDHKLAKRTLTKADIMSYDLFNENDKESNDENE